MNAAGIPVQRRELDRAYEASSRWLARTWRASGRASEPTRARAPRAVDPTLPECLSPKQLAALVQAYANPALLAPPAVDQGARGALEWLAARGVTLGVVSNIMRTPGSVLRQILDRSGLLAPLKVLTFSDECGIRNESRSSA